MAGGEISKTLLYLPAEQGWVPISISISFSFAQPVRELFVALNFVVDED